MSATPMPVPVARDMRYGAAVYGSFLAASVISVADLAGDDARTMTGTLFASMLVFWLAHVWSEVVGEHVASGSDTGMRRIAAVARREWPLMESGAVPTVLLALAWAGVWPRDTGATLAFVAAVAQIAGWGFVAGRRSGGAVPSAVLLGAVQAALALGLLAVKGLLH
jgi:hypothetical protein